MDRPHFIPRAPGRIVFLRVLVLARLLTIITGIAAALTYLGIVIYLVVTPGEDDLSFGRWLVDIRFWVSIFIFWVGMVYLIRRPLRLDAVDKDTKP